jgi:hypothetical protein
MYSRGIDPANNIIFKYNAVAGLGGFNLECHMTILAAPAGLANVAIIDFFDRARDRLAVRYLRPANSGLDAKLAHHAIHNNIQVKFTHTRDDRLASFLVRTNPKGGVFFGKLAQRFDILS